MNTALSELWFLSRDRAAQLWIFIAFVAASTALYFGVTEISVQRATLDRLISADIVEQEASLRDHRDWGSAAYYTFHLTYDGPSDFAFAALGQRDISPWKHRIRMLALEGQIYETDAANPEFALIGRFDFAFVISVLMPLLVVLLLFDLRSGERAHGRLELLDALSLRGDSLWRWRAGWRCTALAAALLIPLMVTGWMMGSDMSTLSLASVVVILHIVFWWNVAAWVTLRGWSDLTNLTALVGIWLLLTVAVPFGMKAVIDKMVPVPDGGDIMLTQREAVNDAWDLPVSATMEPFLARYPEWSDYAEIEGAFEWKWYYAFQQVGDQTAEPLSHAYRQGREERERLAALLSWLSPPAKAERLLQSLAQTDVQATFAYEDKIRCFHKELRAFYYARLFPGRPFTDEDVSARPHFRP